jgi:hypothetical protein
LPLEADFFGIPEGVLEVSAQAGSLERVEPAEFQGQGQHILEFLWWI